MTTTIPFYTLYPRLTAAWLLLCIDNIGAADFDLMRNERFPVDTGRVQREFTGAQLQAAEAQAKELDAGPLGTLAGLSPGPLSQALEDFCIGEETDEIIAAKHKCDMLTRVVEFMFNILCEPASTIEVWHWQYRDIDAKMSGESGFFGFSEDRARNIKAGDDPTFVYGLAATVETDDLDDAYERTNHIDKDWCTNRGVTRPEHGSRRSTSVGDLLIDTHTGERHVVASIGFNKLED